MTYDCGVALLLPAHVNDGARRSVAHMREAGISLEYALTHEHTPHITLYQGRFASEAIAVDAWKEVKKQYRRQRGTLPIIILSGTLDVRPSRDVFWNAEVSFQLLVLHEWIALGMNARSGGLLLPQAQSALRGATTAERIRIMRFGMLATGGQYHPHVTLGRIASGDDAERTSGHAPPKRVFAPLGLVFGPIDEYGRMKESELFEY
jgi:hypothetical protein